LELHLKVIERGFGNAVAKNISVYTDRITGGYFYHIDANGGITALLRQSA